MFDFLSHLGVKDVPALVISIVSLVIAVTNAAHSILSKRSEGLKAAQADFDATIEALVDLRQRREELRRELGDGWIRNSNSGMRAALNDKRELLLSVARHVLGRHKVRTSDIALVIIGATLSDTGRHADAVTYYRSAVEAASSRLPEALSRRVLGRAMILAGQFEGKRQLRTVTFTT